ncbi:hypothetical protein ACO0QE_000168 [Hanseniaspora vineae]
MNHTPKNGNSTKSVYTASQTPTMQNVVIVTPLDVLILLQIVLLDQHTTSDNKAAQQGKFPLCMKRLDETCIKQLCQHGNIFVFREKESKMKRWTDKLNWSPSRIVMNKFLVYKQLVNHDIAQKPNNYENDHGFMNLHGIINKSTLNQKQGDKLMYTGLCKKTISLKFQNDIVHVVAYYNEKMQSLQYAPLENRFEIHNNQHHLKSLTEIYGASYPINKELQENMEKCSVGTTTSSSTSISNSTTTSVCSSSSSGGNRSRSNSKTKTKRRTSSNSSSNNTIKNSRYGTSNSEESLVGKFAMPLSPPHSIMESSFATHHAPNHPTEHTYNQVSPLHYPSTPYHTLVGQNNVLMSNTSNTHKVQKQQVSLPKPSKMQNGLQILQQQLQKPYMSGDGSTHMYLHPTTTSIQHNYNPQNALHYATTATPLYQHLNASGTQLSLHPPPPPPSFPPLQQQQYGSLEQRSISQQHRPLVCTQQFFLQPAPLSKSPSANSGSYQPNQLPSVQDLKLPTIQ